MREKKFQWKKTEKGPARKSRFCGGILLKGKLRTAAGEIREGGKRKGAGHVKKKKWSRYSRGNTSVLLRHISAGALKGDRAPLRRQEEEGKPLERRVFNQIVKKTVGVAIREGEKLAKKGESALHEGAYWEERIVRPHLLSTLDTPGASVTMQTEKPFCNLRKEGKVEWQRKNKGGNNHFYAHGQGDDNDTSKGEGGGHVFLQDKRENSTRKPEGEDELTLDYVCCQTPTKKGEKNGAQPTKKKGAE